MFLIKTFTLQGVNLIKAPLQYCKSHAGPAHKWKHRDLSCEAVTCTQMCSLVTAVFEGAEMSPQGARTLLFYLPCLDVAQLRALRWMTQMCLHVWHSKCLPRSEAQPFENQISRVKFCSVLASIELTSQVFLAGIRETNQRHGVGCSCTDPRCKWGAVAWPPHTKTLTVSSCFCKDFQHQHLHQLFGTFSCWNPVPPTRRIWCGLRWVRSCGVLSLEKHWARFTGLGGCTQKGLEGSAKVPIQVCQS